MSIEEQLRRIETINNEEVRIEAVNHIFSMENSTVHFSYTALLTLVASLLVTVVGTLFAFTYQQVNLYYMMPVVIFLISFIAMLLAIYLQSQKRLEELSSSYLVVVSDLIIRRQGVIHL